MKKTNATTEKVATIRPWGEKWIVANRDGDLLFRADTEGEAQQWCTDNEFDLEVQVTVRKKLSKSPAVYEPKFTPGPWVPGWYDATETFKQRIAEERQCAIVQDTNPFVGRGMLIAVCGDLKDEQSRADAKLMAKAPEMFAQLVEHLEALRNLTGRECYDSGQVPCQCTACKTKALLKEITEAK